MMVMFFLKWVLVLGLFALGAVFLVNGLAIEIALVKYKSLEAHGLPVGIAFLVAGVALAYFWKISSRTIRREIIRPDGSLMRVVEETTKGFWRPF